MVDTGRWPGEGAASWPARIRRLDALIVTHPDEDHTGGAAAVLFNLESARSCSGPCARRRARAAAPDGARARYRRWRSTREQSDGWRPRGARAVAAGRLDRRRQRRQPGGGTVGTVRVLRAATEAASERELMMQGIDLQADVLQLGHHGSRTSSTRAFLTAVAPRVALTASGTRPRYAYPTPRCGCGEGGGAVVLAQMARSRRCASRSVEWLTIAA
jgi:competence protein ComEC